MAAKYAISGAHGTGKSTLIGLLADAFPQIIAVPEVPRAVCEAVNDPTYFHREHNSIHKQSLLVADQISQESLNMAGGVMMTDRCVVDHWAYTALLFPDHCNSQIGRLWFDIVARWSDSYDIVFLANIEDALIDDGLRETDSSFQHRVELELRRLFDTLNVDVIELHGDMEMRFATVSATAGRDLRIGH